MQVCNPVTRDNLLARFPGLINDPATETPFFPICFLQRSSPRGLKKTVCVVGLGYVGLPLAEAFSRHVRTIGYRRNQKAVDELSNCVILT